MKNPFPEWDQQVLNSVHLLTRGYNWLTGGSRRDLADKLVTLAPIIESTGYYFLHPLLGVGVCAATMWYSHKSPEFHEMIERGHEEQEECEAINLVHLTDTELVKVEGYVIGAVGFGLMFANNLPPEYANFEDAGKITGAGLMIRGLAGLVMAGNDLPRRKNFLRRGLEVLERRLQPAYS